MAEQLKTRIEENPLLNELSAKEFMPVLVYHVLAAASKTQVYDRFLTIRDLLSIADESAESLRRWANSHGLVHLGHWQRHVEIKTLPVLPVYPQGLAPTGKHFPHLTTWVEGYDPVAIGNTLQASQLGHVFIWDLQTNVYRQVTCLNDVGAYRGGITMMPGDPTGRYALIMSVIGNTKIIHVKDLRAAGIMSEDGHLLPPPTAGRK